MGDYRHIGLGFAKDLNRHGYLWVRMLGNEKVSIGCLALLHLHRALC
jgi:hypothetical protein